jgi:hypothetical protein
VNHQFIFVTRLRHEVGCQRGTLLPFSNIPFPNRTGQFPGIRLSNRLEVRYSLRNIVLLLISLVSLVASRIPHQRLSSADLSTPLPHVTGFPCR